MSTWYDALDVDIDADSSTVAILVNSDDQGNTYVQIPFKQIKAIHEGIVEIEASKVRQILTKRED